MISSPCSRAGERAHPHPQSHSKPPDLPSGGFAVVGHTAAEATGARPASDVRIHRPSAMPPLCKGRWQKSPIFAGGVADTGRSAKPDLSIPQSAYGCRLPFHKGAGGCAADAPPLPIQNPKSPRTKPVRGLDCASPQNLSCAAKHARLQGRPRGQGPPRMRSIQKAPKPIWFGGFLHPLFLLPDIQRTLACFCRRLRQSAIMAMNSEFVGLPLMFETV